MPKPKELAPTEQRIVALIRKEGAVTRKQIIMNLFGTATTQDKFQGIAVRSALKWLEATEYINVNRNDRAFLYTLKNK